MLALFFGLVIVCAVFFSLGYTLGRKSDVGLVATVAAAPQNISNGAKPGSSSSQPAAPMTFYKAVEQKDANPQLTPASESSSGASGTDQPAAAATQAQASASESTATLPTSGYFVQVAAVSKQDDAEALVDALKKKQYPAFVSSPSTDKLFRVQVGPFGQIKDAEAMRARLINDGYSPILKK